MEQVETGRQKQLKEESSELIREIDALLADNTRKVSTLIDRKRNECLGSHAPTALPLPTPHFTHTLSQRLKTTSIAPNLHLCHQILGEIRIQQQLYPSPHSASDPPRSTTPTAERSSSPPPQPTCAASSPL